MTAAEDGAPTPLDAARALGLAYVEFALANPELYRLATMTPADSASDVDAVMNVAAFAHLTRCVRTLQEAGYYPPADPLPIA